MAMCCFMRDGVARDVLDDVAFGFWFHSCLCVVVVVAACLCVYLFFKLTSKKMICVNFK